MTSTLSDALARLREETRRAEAHLASLGGASFLDGLAAAGDVHLARRRERGVAATATRASGDALSALFQAPEAPAPTEPTSPVRDGERAISPIDWTETDARVAATPSTSAPHAPAPEESAFLAALNSEENR